MPNPWWSIALWAWSSGMCNPASVKQRHYFTNKGQSSQSYGFSSSHVWMWELDYFKKAEHWRIDAFELWCWKRLLRVPWAARRSNLSILKGISPEYSLEGLMLKLSILSTCCEELTHLKRPWCWERLKAGGEGDNRGWDGLMTSPIDGHESEQALGVGEGQGRLAFCSPWGCKELDTSERLNWTDGNDSQY